MALPPWTVELLRRGLADVASKAGEPATLRRLKEQATGLLQELPETAARGINRVIQSAEAGKESVQRWSRRHTSLAVPLLNASGVLHHELGTGVPVAERVIDVGREVLRGDVVLGAEMALRISRRLERSLPDRDGISIAVASSFPAALSALSLVGTHRTLVVHRHHAVRILEGVPLPEAFGTILPMVAEVGATDRVDPEDFEGLERACVISADDGILGFEAIQLADCEAIQAVILTAATLAETPSRLVPSAEAVLRQGAGLVVLSGEGIAGGPPCGIVVGRREEIETIRMSASWSALEASLATQAMMAVAAESASDQDAADAIHPVDALISTSEENLRDRAERIATRLSSCESIATTRVADDAARITRDGRWRLPSRQLVLTHRSLSPAAWERKLAEDLPAIAVSTSQDALRVDLRWLNPAYDGQLAESLGRN